MPVHSEEPFDRHAEEQTRSAEAIRARLAREFDQPLPPPPEAPPIPDHRLLQRIGSGAYGEVWLASSALQTLRAIKIVYRERFKDDRPYEREFGGILKYEPISRTHEGLVQVLHVGRNDESGCFYYVMELADNCSARAEADLDRANKSPTPAAPAAYLPRTLRSELAERNRLPPTEAAHLALHLARALAHLHLHGLVHRDIKPSNVIFVGGQPKLADIGLVTDVGSSRSFVGTEGFIPPEGPGNRQADLYGLGKLLYELATGRDRMDFPQLPPHVHQLPDGEGLLELNEVMTRACAPELKERYATATEMQADLNLFLAGRSLRRARNFERYLALSKKLVTVGCGLFLVLLTALWFSKREEHHALEIAEIATGRALAEAKSRAKETGLRLRAEAAERETQQQLYTALLEQARATVRSGEIGQRVRSLDAIRRAAAISNRVELRREAMAALALPDLRYERDAPLDPSYVMICPDPALERVAVCRGRTPVEIRALADNQLLATLPASTNLMAYGATWSRDGQYLAVKRDFPGGGLQAELEVWAVAEIRRVALIHDARFNARTFHPRQRHLLVAQADGAIATWDLETGQETGRRRLVATPQDISYSPDGKQVAASYLTDAGWVVSTHDAETAKPLVSRSLTNMPFALQWHPDNTRIAIADNGGSVHLLDAHTGQLYHLGRHKAEAATLAFSPSGDYLVSGGWERELICWDVRTMQRAFTIAVDSYVAQFGPDGRTIALIRQDGLQLHAFQSPTAHRALGPDMGSRLWHATFSPDGRWLAACADSRIGVWDLKATGAAAFAPVGFETQLFWAAEPNTLYGSNSGKAHRWHVEPATNPIAPPTLEPLELRQPAGYLSLSVGSNWVAWTSSSGSQVSAFENPLLDPERWAPTTRGINRVSPDGRWLAIYRAYGSILHIYRLPQLEPVAILTNRAAIAGVNFSPLQDEIAVGSRGQVEFWSTRNWEQKRAATNFIGLPYIGMLYEPKAESIWLLKDLRSAGLYQARTLIPKLHLPNGMLPLALSSDGRYLAVSVEARRLEVWDLTALRAQLRDLGLDWNDS